MWVFHLLRNQKWYDGGMRRSLSSLCNQMKVLPLVSKFELVKGLFGCLMGMEWLHWVCYISAQWSCSISTRNWNLDKHAYAPFFMFTFWFFIFFFHRTVNFQSGRWILDNMLQKFHRCVCLFLSDLLVSLWIERCSFLFPLTNEAFCLAYHFQVHPVFFFSMYHWLYGHFGHM